MRRAWQLGLAGVAVSAALAGGVAAATGHGDGQPGPKRGHSEHFVTVGDVGQNLVQVNTGDAAAGPGDYAVFKYDLVSDGKDAKSVGDAYVTCVRIDPPKM